MNGTQEGLRQGEWVNDINTVVIYVIHLNM